MNIVTVVPLVKGLPREELTYFSGKDVPKLSLVTVFLRKKKVLGLAIDCKSVVEAKAQIKKADFNLKKIIEVKEAHFFSEEFIESALALSGYFLTTKSSAVSHLIPAPISENYEKVETWQITNKENIVDESIKPEKLLFQAPLEERLSYYRTLIRGHFANKQSVLIVLPTALGIELFTERLSKGIEQFTFNFSSEKTDKKVLSDAKKMLEMDHPVLVIITPIYMCLPRRDFATIVLENESSNAWRTVVRPQLDLRSYVEQMAERSKKRLVLADTLLRFETIARKDTENMGSVRSPSFRVNFDGRIVVDERNPEKRSEQRFRVFSHDTLESISRRIEKKKKVFIFALRKGLGTTTLCRDCGDMLLCENCNSPVVLYFSKDRTSRMYVCNRCGQEDSPKAKCKNCDSWNLEAYGIGTDTCVEELKEFFPTTHIAKLDKESAKTTKSAKKIVDDWEKNTESSIIVGTEMALNYINAKADLSVVASFDSLWSIPNFRMSEKILNLIFAVLSKTETLAIIQTRNANDDILDAVQKDNLLNFVREELATREELGYPPYKRFIKVTHTGQKEDIVKVKEFLEKYFSGYSPAIYSAFVDRQKNAYKTNVLIRLENSTWCFDGNIRDKMLERKLRALPDTFNVYVDPEDLL